jgi:hypothetical protein
VDVTGEHVVQRRRRAAVMHRGHLDASHAFQQRHVDLARRADAGVAVGELAGPAFRQRDQLGDGVRRQRWRRQ